MGEKTMLGRWQVSVAEQDCSLCGACAQWCGPGALTLKQADDAAVLRFAAERCPGCGLCVEACPEKAVVLTQTTSRAWPGPAVTLASSQLSKCARCGATSVPSRMLGSMSRWNETLGGSADAKSEDFTTCMACRSDMLFFGGSLNA